MQVHFHGAAGEVTGSMHLFGSGEHIADELRRRMREMVGPSPGAGHPAAPDTSAPRPNAPR